MKKQDYLALGNISVDDAAITGILQEMTGTQVEDKYWDDIPHSYGKSKRGRVIREGDSITYWDVRKKGRRGKGTTPKEKLTVGARYNVEKVSWQGNRITVIDDNGDKIVVGTNRFVFHD